MFTIVNKPHFVHVCLLLYILILSPTLFPTHVTAGTVRSKPISSRNGNSPTDNMKRMLADEAKKKKYYTTPLAIDELDSLKMVENATNSAPRNISSESSISVNSFERSKQERNGSIYQKQDREDSASDRNSSVVGEASKPVAVKIESQTYSRGDRKDRGPFSVHIEDQKFYGGLITYIHHLHPARICRVLNPCIRHDGVLVLPKWMQRHDNLLNFHCGQKKLEFSADNTSPPASMNDLDLIGLSLPRPSIPDFVRDFLPNAIVFDLIYGDRDARTSCHSRKGSSCESFPSLNESLNTAIFLPPRLEALEQKHSWVREFVKLMKPPNAGRQAKVLYNYPDADEDNGMKCFRSAFFTRGPFSKYHIMSDHLQELNFLKSHGISKKARHFQQSAEHGSTNSASCQLNITISNRKLNDDDPKQLIGRYITNIPNIRTEIVKQADRVPGLNVHVAAITLEGKSLWWQINAMQKTDIWVAGHGPLLTNMLFMRQNSTAIEIQPFTYYPQVYERIAQHLAHVNYDRYIANPDEEAFEKCINQVYQSGHSSYNEVRTLHDRYLRAAKKFFQSDSTHSLVLHTLEGRGLDYVRACARMQRLTTNGRNFAIAIVRQARIRCGLPPPRPFESEGEVNLTI
ncbi:unnamed protein product [Agarophyton chilense]